MNRFGAFGIHLGISLVLFLILGYLILFHWYPDFFFTTDGGWQGIRIIALVDLVLGPMLTLCVYKAGKPGLRTDLTLIGVFQAACLVAGTFVVYTERPVALVYSDGFFHSMTAGDYAEVGKPSPELRHLPGPSPKWIRVALPEDPTQQSEVRRHAINNRIPLATLTEYYQPFDPRGIDMERDPQPPGDLQKARSSELAAFTQQHGGEPSDYLYFPLGTRYHLALLALRKSNLDPAGVILLPVTSPETKAVEDETPASEAAPPAPSG